MGYMRPASEVVTSHVPVWVSKNIGRKHFSEHNRRLRTGTPYLAGILGMDMETLDSSF